MGNDQSQQLQLRESSIMTQLLLKQEDEVIRHLEEEEVELNRPINQMGDRISHYAAYQSMYKLLLWLIQKDVNFQTVYNHRRLSPIDVAVPQTRQWIYNKVNEYRVKKASMSPVRKQTITRNTPQGNLQNTSVSNNEKSSQMLKRKLTQKASESNENSTYQKNEKQPNEKNEIVDKRQQSSKKDSLEFTNILFGQKA